MASSYLGVYDHDGAEIYLDTVHRSVGRTKDTGAKRGNVLLESDPLPHDDFGHLHYNVALGILSNFWAISIDLYDHIQS